MELIVKLLEDMEVKIKEVKELLATFRKLQLELEPLAMPTLERCDIPDSPTKFADALEIAFTEPKKRGRKKKIQA
jgi:hypothetical protein